MNNHTTSITTNKKHHYRELLAIGIPIIIGQLGTIILGFADTLMIGHHSTPELAAAGLVNNIFGLVFVSYMGFTYGLTPIIGRLYGEERTDCIGQKVRNAFCANMLTGFIFTLALVVLYLNLGHIGQPEELLSLIRPYFLVNLASVLFMGIFFTMKQFLDGLGQTKVAMWAMIGGNVINILGNWVLIYGVAGFPELGLLGAGISTLVSRILMALAMVGMLMTGKNFGAGHGIGCLHAELCDGGLAGNHSAGGSSGDDYPLAALLSRAFGHGGCAGYPREPFYGTEGLRGSSPKCLRRVPSEPAVLAVYGFAGVPASPSDRWLV